jgi:hypothetical protein
MSAAPVPLHSIVASTAQLKPQLRTFISRAARLAWEAKLMQCSRCKEVYHPDENGPALCNFHVGPTESWPRNQVPTRSGPIVRETCSPSSSPESVLLQGCHDTVVYLCCGAHDVGEPVLIRSPGCKKGPHMDKYEHLFWRMGQKKLDAERRMQQHEMAQLRTSRDVTPIPCLYAAHSHGARY